MAGFVLTRQTPAGRWGVATYALKKTGEEGHRGYRGHKTDDPDDPDDEAEHDCNGHAFEAPILGAGKFANYFGKKEGV
jgi:hypothetical protein